MHLIITYVAFPFLLPSYNNLFQELKCGIGILADQAGTILDHVVQNGQNVVWINNSRTVWSI